MSNSSKRQLSIKNHSIYSLNLSEILFKPIFNIQQRPDQQAAVLPAFKVFKDELESGLLVQIVEDSGIFVE